MKLSNYIELAIKSTNESLYAWDNSCKSYTMSDVTSLLKGNLSVRLRDYYIDAGITIARRKVKSIMRSNVSFWLDKIGNCIYISKLCMYSLDCPQLQEVLLNIDYENLRVRNDNDYFNKSRGFDRISNKIIDLSFEKLEKIQF